MVRVEPFGYPLDNRFIIKLDNMIKRCTTNNPKRDAVLIFEGAEGEGKTTYSIACAYYISWKTGRPFDHTRVFFDVRKMINFLKDREDEIAIWDEPAFQALSKDSLTKIVKDLERLLMMARKKRHFIMINMSYFNKFSEYIVWQRPLGMLHVYSKKQKYAGRFKYIKKKNLERLWEDWRKYHKRNQHKYSLIRGTFPDVLNPKYKFNVLSHFNLEEYEKAKDNAISMIGAKEDEPLKAKEDLKEFKGRIATIKFPLNNFVELAKFLGVTQGTISNWRRYLKKKKSTRESGYI